MSRKQIKMLEASVDNYRKFVQEFIDIFCDTEPSEQLSKYTLLVNKNMDWLIDEGYMIHDSWMDEPPTEEEIAAFMEAENSPSEPWI